MTRQSLAAIASAIAFSMQPAHIDAQRPAGAPTRVPVTIVLMERPAPSDAPFGIQRRVGLEPHDVIMLRSDATGDQLSDAVRSLLVIRQGGGDTASASATMRLRPRGSQGAPGSRRAFPWVQRVLADLRRAEPREVAGIGRVRAVQIWLPPQRRRAPAP